jgi:glycosyltransferase involved in cell wall biosynthesis
MVENLKLFAVIPAHNESAHIKNVVMGTKKYVSKVIVVDDASKDDTFEIASKAGATVLRHIVNLGLGGTLKTGCDAAILLGADAIVTLDGDGQHDPSEIPKLLDAMKRNNSDAVFGERPFNKEMPFVKRLGNYFFLFYSKYLFGIKVRDTQTGFRLFTKEAYQKIRWSSTDYAVASEMLINAERARIKYVPQEVRTIYNDDFKGTTILDGVKIANKMMRLKFR